MKRFRIKKRTAFYTPDRSIKIYDSRGVIFYDSDEIANFTGYFTLPRINLANSLFLTNGRLYRVEYKDNFDISLPPYERNMQHDFAKFKITFSENPNKCTIFHNEKRIDFDNSFKRFPYYCLYFILFHEVGHNYYKTEEFADMYAVKRMLKKGYTPYQIMLGAVDSLSDKSESRLRNILTTIKNAKK